MSLVRRVALLWVAVFCIHLLVVGLQQQATGAFDRDYAMEGDEAAHYVTGLMMRDYIASGHWSQPRKFAQNYYNHLPKVAIGHWPPTFYVVQAAWTSLFSASQWSMMLMQNVMYSLAMTILVWILKREVGLWLALGITVFLTMLPASRIYTGRMMAEPMLMLLMLLALVGLTGYLERGSKWDLAAFCFWTTLAGLAKPNAVLMLLGATFAFIALDKFLQLFHKWVLLALFIPFLGAFGWIAATWVMLKNGWVPLTSWQASGYNAQLIADLGGWAMSFAFLMGSILICIRSKGLKANYVISIVSAAMVAAALWFYDFVSVVAELRHWVLLLPPIAIVATSGVKLLWDELAGFRLARLALATFLLAAMISVPIQGLARAETKRADERDGANRLAASIVSNPHWRGKSLLILSKGHGEGALIAALAMREGCCDRTVVRGSKLLATSDWTGIHYRLNHKVLDNFATELMRQKVDLIALDTAPAVNLSKGNEHVIHVETILNHADRTWVPVAGRGTGFLLLEATREPTREPLRQRASTPETVMSHR